MKTRGPCSDGRSGQRPAAPAAVAVAAAMLFSACAPKSEPAADSPSFAHSFAVGPGPLTVTRPTPAPDAPAPLEYPGLHNVVAYSPGLLSGSAPDGPAGFQTLKAMGVRTVISVDGAAPDLKDAGAEGIRYVHLPIGYNGMDEQRTLQIARAVQDARAADPDAPVYIHCHHGKHRSAGATGAAAVTLGTMTSEAALARMEVSGTSPSYKGLFQCVAVAHVAGPTVLASVDNQFPSVWKPTGVVHSMVEIDQINENLRIIETAGWNAPATHPDLVPAAEAGRLADLLRVLTDDHAAASRPAEFSQWLRDASAKATALESGLAAPAASGPGAHELSRRYALLAATCAHCHARYRD